MSKVLDWRFVEGWICVHPDGEVDHNWYWEDDWYGDPSVINGTADCGRWVCVQCGEEDLEREPPSYCEDFIFSE